MSVLQGYIVESNEVITGVMYKGEFYSPLDLALEAYEHFSMNRINTATEILALIEECMNEDYLEGYGGLLASILYEGMVVHIEQQFAQTIRKLRQCR